MQHIALLLQGALFTPLLAETPTLGHEGEFWRGNSLNITSKISILFLNALLSIFRDSFRWNVPLSHVFWLVAIYCTPTITEEANVANQCEFCIVLRHYFVKIGKSVVFGIQCLFTNKFGSDWCTVYCNERTLPRGHVHYIATTYTLTVVSGIHVATRQFFQKNIFARGRVNLDSGRLNCTENHSRFRFIVMEPSDL